MFARSFVLSTALAFSSTLSFATPSAATIETQLAQKDQQIAELQKKLDALTSIETKAVVKDSPEERERLAVEMLEVTNAKALIEQTVNSLPQTVGKQMDPEQLEIFMKIFAKHFTWEKLSPRYVKLYSDIYSANDLQDMIAFYHSKAGTAMLEKMPVLMQKIMAFVSEYNQEIMPDVAKEMEEVLKKKKQKAAVEAEPLTK